jgi:hypothetical protein
VILPETGIATDAAQQAVAAVGRTSSRPAASLLSPVVKYHGLARCYLLPLGLLLRPQLNGGTLARLIESLRCNMLRTHADAITFLEAAGVPASRRDWVMGDTIVVPLGHASMRDGITVHPAVAWLVPFEDSWAIRQPVAELERELAFSTLRDACDAALAIARAFAIFRSCDTCKSPAQLAFGERPRSPEFWVALRCLSCGAQVESDGTGSLPDELRRLELTRNGTWSVSVKRPTAPTQWTALRRELKLDLPQLANLKRTLAGHVFAGTFAEASRLCTSLSKLIAAELRQDG